MPACPVLHRDTRRPLFCAVSARIFDGVVCEMFTLPGAPNIFFDAIYNQGEELKPGPAGHKYDSY